jgi:hypothetical protein
MMVCQKCGSEYPNDAIICTKCYLALSIRSEERAFRIGDGGKPKKKLVSLEGGPFERGGDGVAKQERLKTRFERFMIRHHWLRFDMTVILGATFLSGVLVSYLLLLIHVTSILVRYPLAVLASYLVFLGCIRLWLHYVIPSDRRRDRVDAGSYVPGGDAGSVSPAPFAGGGGEFGGGGASGSFGGPSDTADQDIINPIYASTGDSGGTSSGGTLKDLFGGGGGGDGDSSGDGFGAIIIAIIAAMVIAAIFGTIGYFIWHASSLLCQAAFQFMLAANLRRHSKTMVHPDWYGSVIRMTWKPFGAIFLLVVMLAGLIHHYFSHCTKLSEVINTLLSYL